MPPHPLDDSAIARRAVREIRPGAVVAVDGRLAAPIPALTPPELGAWFLRSDGTLNNIPLSIADAGAVVRGGHVDLAIISIGQVDVAGNAAGAPTPGHSDIVPPGSAIDLAAGATRVVGLLTAAGRDGTPGIVRELAPSAGIVGRVDLVMTDVGVFQVLDNALALVETAPGWSADDVAALTGIPAPTAPPPEMEFTPPAGRPPGKVYADGLSAVSDLPDGATVLIDGFGGPGGMAHYLLLALRDRGSRGLTIVSNTAGIARVVSFGTPPGQTAIDHSVLIENGQVAKAIASFPVSPSVSRPSEFELAYRRGEVDLELAPQGTLAERLRAGGAGIHAFYTPTGAGTLIAEGKETRAINGRNYILEYGLRADFALIRAHRADTSGNLTYRGTSRNFNAVMAPAARITIAEVDAIVTPEELDPEEIVTPGVFVSRIVQRPAGFTGYE